MEKAITNTIPAHAELTTINDLVSRGNLNTAVIAAATARHADTGTPTSAIILIMSSVCWLVQLSIRPPLALAEKAGHSLIMVVCNVEYCTQDRNASSTTKS